MKIKCLTDSERAAKGLYALPDGKSPPLMNIAYYIHGYLNCNI